MEKINRTIKLNNKEIEFDNYFLQERDYINNKSKWEFELEGEKVFDIEIENCFSSFEDVEAYIENTLDKTKYLFIVYTSYSGYDTYRSVLVASNTKYNALKTLADKLSISENYISNIDCIGVADDSIELNSVLMTDFFNG